MDFSSSAFALPLCWATVLSPEVIHALYQRGVIDVFPEHITPIVMDTHTCTLFKPIFLLSRDSTTTDNLVWVCITCGK
mgnify:CR=1 FL=1